MVSIFKDYAVRSCLQCKLVTSKIIIGLRHVILEILSLPSIEKHVQFETGSEG